MVAKREEPTEDAVRAGEVQPTVEGEDEGGAGCDVCMPPSFGGAEFVRHDAFARRRARAHASRKPLRSKAAPEKPQVQARGGGRVRLQVHLHAVDAVVEGRRRAAEVSRKRREVTFALIVVHGLPARPRHGRGHRDVGRHAHRGRGFRAGGGEPDSGRIKLAADEGRDPTQREGTRSHGLCGDHPPAGRLPGGNFRASPEVRRAVPAPKEKLRETRAGDACFSWQKDSAMCEAREYRRGVEPSRRRGEVRLGSRSRGVRRRASPSSRRWTAGVALVAASEKRARTRARFAGTWSRRRGSRRAS